MTVRARRRGQPLIVLSGLLLSWCALRAAALSLGPVSGAEAVLQGGPAKQVSGLAVQTPGKPVGEQQREVSSMSPGTLAVDEPPVPQFDAAASRVSREPVAAPPPPVVPIWNAQLVPLPPRPERAAPIRAATVRAVPGRSAAPSRTRKGAMRTVAGHQLLYTAALSVLPLPAEVAALEARRTSVQPGKRRWSADAWLLWRQGSTGLAPTAALGGSYGASQAGMVFRYRLTDEARAALAVYFRSSAPLDQPDAAELALGLQAQPLRRLPLRTFAEVRGDRLSGNLRARLSAGVITAIGPQRLPLGFQAEPYGQAGYVTGPGGTWFADGQVRLDRRVLRQGRAELRAGAGVWGGAQRDAARLDAGPGLTLSFPLGSAQARLSADWRYRVAGKAAPDSGLAVTLATGF